MSPKIDQQELQAVLSRLFTADPDCHQNRGFQRRIGSAGSLRSSTSISPTRGRNRAIPFTCVAWRHHAGRATAARGLSCPQPARSSTRPRPTR